MVDVFGDDEPPAIAPRCSEDLDQLVRRARSLGGLKDRKVIDVPADHTGILVRNGCRKDLVGRP